jgi:hypothetical protein
MNRKKLFAVVSLIIALPFLGAVFTSFSYCAKHPLDIQCYYDDTTPPEPAVEKNATLIISGIAFAEKPQNPKYTGAVCPQSPNICEYWGKDAGASTVCESPETKYYCQVTVECTDSKINWGPKTYSGINLPEIQIKVLKNYYYKVKVVYYEQKHSFWADHIYGRGIWFFEKTYQIPVEKVYADTWNFDVRTTKECLNGVSHELLQSLHEYSVSPNM